MVHLNNSTFSWHQDASQELPSQDFHLCWVKLCWLPLIFIFYPPPLNRVKNRVHAWPYLYWPFSHNRVHMRRILPIFGIDCVSWKEEWDAASVKYVSATTLGGGYANKVTWHCSLEYNGWGSCSSRSVEVKSTSGHKWVSPLRFVDEVSAEFDVKILADFGFRLFFLPDWVWYK